METVINHLFEFCFEVPHTKIKVQMLLIVILPLVIMEIKSENDLIQSCSKSLALNITLTDKLKIIFQFITSILWISQKYKTKYHFYSL